MPLGSPTEAPGFRERTIRCGARVIPCSSLMRTSVGVRVLIVVCLRPWRCFDSLGVDLFDHLRLDAVEHRETPIFTDTQTTPGSPA